MVKYAVQIDLEGLSFTLKEITRFREALVGEESLVQGRSRPVIVWSAKDEVRFGSPHDDGGIERFPREQCFDSLAEACSFLEKNRISMMDEIRSRTRKAGREIKEYNRRIRSRRAKVRELWLALRELARLDINDVDAKRS